MCSGVVNALADTQACLWNIPFVDWSCSAHNAAPTACCEQRRLPADALSGREQLQSSSSTNLGCSTKRIKLLPPGYGLRRCADGDERGSGVDEAQLFVCDERVSEQLTGSSTTAFIPLDLSSHVLSLRRRSLTLPDTLEGRGRLRRYSSCCFVLGRPPRFY